MEGGLLARPYNRFACKIQFYLQNIVRTMVLRVAWRVVPYKVCPVLGLFLPHPPAPSPKHQGRGALIARLFFALLT